MNLKHYIFILLCFSLISCLSLHSSKNKIIPSENIAYLENQKAREKIQAESQNLQQNYVANLEQDSQLITDSSSEAIDPKSIIKVENLQNKDPLAKQKIQGESFSKTITNTKNINQSTIFDKENKDKEAFLQNFSGQQIDNPIIKYNPNAVSKKNKKKSNLSVKNKSSYYLQLGAFTKRKNAELLEKSASKYGETTIISIRKNRKLLYKVVMGPYFINKAKQQQAIIQRKLSISKIILIKDE